MTGGITAFSGGTYDSKRHELLIFGGGHGDGNGNEVLAFNLDTMTWRRVIDRSLNQYLRHPSNPSLIEVLGDGKPNSRHTYGGIVYLPVQDRMWTWGGSLASGSGGGSKGIWELDLATPIWIRKTDNPSTSVAHWAVYNPVTKKIIYGGDNSAIRQYDPITGFNTLLYSWSFPREEPNAVLDTQRQLLLLIGHGLVYSYDLNNTSSAPIARTTSGPQGAVNAWGPGLVFDPRIKEVIAWTGLDADRRTVYTLDTGTWVWTSSVGTGVIPDTPANGTYSRTYGRWQYSPEKNVYMVWNRPSASVYLYRPYANPVSLSNRTWTHRTYAPWGSSAGYGGQSKHTRLLYDSKRYKVVLAGGDIYLSPAAGDGSNYVFSIDLASSADPKWALPVGWSAGSWCPSGGTIIPGVPDNVGWAYDSKRDKFIMTPGFYFVTQQGHTNCTGLTDVRTPVLFNPTTGNWESVPWSAPTNGYGAKFYNVVYDPVGDAMYRVGGNKIYKLDLAANTWSYYTYTNPPSGQYDDFAEISKLAIDVARRKLYWLQQNLVPGHYTYSGYINIANIKNWPPTVTRSSTAAPGWVDFQTDGSFEGKIAFDSLNRVVMVPDYNSGMQHAGRINSLYFYHVDTDTWEVESAPPEPFSSNPLLYVRLNELTYDEYNNTFVLIGGNDSFARGFWLYRYGSRTR
jgi:hypothetical protein